MSVRLCEACCGAPVVHRPPDDLWLCQKCAVRAVHRKGRADLATRITAAREHSKLKQHQVATRMGLRRPAISQIETGERRVDAVELFHLAKIYKTTMLDLLGPMDASP